MDKKIIICFLVSCFLSFSFVPVFAEGGGEDTQSVNDFLLEMGMTQEELDVMDSDIKFYMAERLKSSGKEDWVYIPGVDPMYVEEQDWAANQFMGLHLNAWDAAPVQSELVVNYFQKSGSKIENLEDKLDCKVYRFTSEEYGDRMCWTIMDLSSVQELKVSKKDTLCLDASDFAFTQDAIEGELWIRNTLEEKWERKKYISASAGKDHAVELMGKEWRTRDKYFRVMLCIKAGVLQQRSDKLPVYYVDYVNVVPAFPFGVVWCAGAVCFTAMVLFIGDKLRKGNRMKKFVRWLGKKEYQIGK